MSGTTNLADLAAWRKRAGQLAAHTKRFYVNRSDVWGKYIHTRKRDRMTTWTAPPVAKRGEVELSFRNIRNHFEGNDGSIIGLHSTSADNRCKWVGIDIDQHDDGDFLRDIATRNLDFAISIVAELQRLGFRSPLIEDSNRKGGLHVWVLFKDDSTGTGIPSQLAHRFGSWLVRNWQEFGFDQQPEVFPKQPELTETRTLGNWLRLPGVHHTNREHISRFFDVDSHQWLTGEDACRAFLSALPDNPKDIPQEVFEFRTAEEIEAEERQTERQHHPDRHRHHNGCGCHDNGVRPGDDYNERGEPFEDLLHSLGWSHVGGELWRRPGKTDSHSATLRDGVFYNFSAASELPHSEGMSKFAVYAHGFHNGNFAMAAAELSRQGFGSKEIEPDWEDKALDDMAAGRLRANGHVVSCGCHHCECEDAGVCPRDCDCPTCESERAVWVAEGLTIYQAGRERLGQCGGRRPVWSFDEGVIKFYTNDCGSWDCDHCRAAIIDGWLSPIEVTFERETADGQRLHVGDIPLGELDAVKRGLRHRGARYLSIADEAFSETALLVSTVPFQGSEPHDSREAFEAVKNQFRWIDVHGVPRKPIYTCKAWERGIDPEPEKETDFKNVKRRIRSGRAVIQTCRELGLPYDGLDDENFAHGEWGTVWTPDFCTRDEMEHWVNEIFADRAVTIERQARRAMSSGPRVKDFDPGTRRHGNRTDLADIQPRGPTCPF